MSRWDHHPPCPGGCGELADECACRRPNPLGSMRIVEPVKRPETLEALTGFRDDPERHTP